jgi:hypothetical protein
MNLAETRHVLIASDHHVLSLIIKVVGPFDNYVPLEAKPAYASARNLVAVGHAHIDSAWLWPVRETIRARALEGRFVRSAACGSNPTPTCRAEKLSFGSGSPETPSSWRSSAASRPRSGCGHVRLHRGRLQVLSHTEDELERNQHHAAPELRLGGDRRHPGLHALPAGRRLQLAVVRGRARLCRSATAMAAAGRTGRCAWNFTWKLHLSGQDEAGQSPQRAPASGGRDLGVDSTSAAGCGLSLRTAHRRQTQRPAEPIPRHPARQLYRLRAPGRRRRLRNRAPRSRGPDRNIPGCARARQKRMLRSTRPVRCGPATS